MAVRLSALRGGRPLPLRKIHITAGRIRDGKDKVAPVFNELNTSPWRRMEIGCIDPHFLDFGSSWRQVVSFTPRPLYPEGKSHLYPSYRRLGGPQSRSGRRREEKILSPTGIRTLTPRSSSTFLFEYGGWSPYWVHAALRPLLAYCTCPGWLWGWRSWWNERFWHGKLKYSEKTCPDATLSTTNPT
jgi:hypothetical protein